MLGLDFGGTPPNTWIIMRLVNMLAEAGSVTKRPYDHSPYDRQFRYIQEFRLATDRRNLELAHGHYNV